MLCCQQLSNSCPSTCTFVATWHVHVTLLSTSFSLFLVKHTKILLIARCSPDLYIVNFSIGNIFEWLRLSEIYSLQNSFTQKLSERKRSITVACGCLQCVGVPRGEYMYACTAGCNKFAGNKLCLPELGLSFLCFLGLLEACFVKQIIPLHVSSLSLSADSEFVGE